MTTPDAARRGRVIAGALLASELDAQRAIAKVVKTRTGALAVDIQDGRDVHKSLRRHIDEIADDAEKTIAEARTAARTEARKSHKAALLLLLIGGKSDSDAREIRRRVRDAFTRIDAGAVAGFDLTRARIAAQHLANSWGNATLRALTPTRKEAEQRAPSDGPYRTAGKRADYESATKVSRTVPEAVKPGVRRIAVTEVAAAHNDEARRFYEALPAEIRDEIELRWNAILDMRTCAYCEGQDGKRIVSDFPPAHGNCRCFVTTYRRRG